MSPIRPFDVLPHLVRPQRIVFCQRPAIEALVETDRAGDQVLRGNVFQVRDQSAEVFALGRPLGDGDISGRVDKRLELRVGDFGPIHPETVQRDGVRGTLIRRTVVVPHHEGAARNPNHAVRRRPRRSQLFVDLEPSNCLTELPVLRRFGCRRRSRKSPPGAGASETGGLEVAADRAGTKVA